VGSILSLAPPDLVDLFLNLERFQVVEFRFVRLKLCVELVLAAFLGFVSFEEDYSASFVSSCEVISRVVEFDRG
jgi:hypothetical protein